MPESPSVARELIEHSQALRLLAKDLVLRSDADDLVQDTNPFPLAGSGSLGVLDDHTR